MVGVGVYEVGPRLWNVIHLGSGHLICRLVFPSEVPLSIAAAKAQVLATAIAGAGCWTFEGIEGWKAADPQLSSRLQAIQGLYEGFISGGVFGASDESARAVRSAEG